MRDLSYPATLTPDDADGGYVVTFPDLSEAITQGETVENALTEAADALDEAIAGRIRRGDVVPAPSEPLPGQPLVRVPPTTAARATRYHRFGAARVRAATEWPREFWDAFGEMPDGFERPAKRRSGQGGSEC